MNTYVMLPTYNEAENIVELILELRKTLPDSSILIVDDSSPDGTAEKVRLIEKNDQRVKLLLRPREIKGRGWAGRDGFVKCLHEGAEAVVEMDADLSHQPRFLSDLLGPLQREEADVVIGSRYIPGGKDMDRSFHRQWTSLFARLYLNFVLGLRVKDPTSGYRAFSRRALERIRPETLIARDPFCVTEILYRCRQAGLRIQEVPIEFVDRKAGESKLGLLTLVRYLGKAAMLRFRRHSRV